MMHAAAEHGACITDDMVLTDPQAVCVTVGTL